MNEFIFNFAVEKLIYLDCKNDICLVPVIKRMEYTLWPTCVRVVYKILTRLKLAASSKFFSHNFSLYPVQKICTRCVVNYSQINAKN